MKQENTHKLEYLQCDKEMNIKINLSKLIELTPNKNIFGLYMKSQNSYYPITLPLKIEKISFPSKQWDEELYPFEEGLWDLSVSSSQRVYEYMSKWSDHDFTKYIINDENYNWTLKEIKDFFNEDCDNYELDEYMNNNWFSLGVNNMVHVEWFIIELFKYHNIVDDNHHLDTSLNLGEMLRDVAINEILEDKY